MRWIRVTAQVTIYPYIVTCIRIRALLYKVKGGGPRVVPFTLEFGVRFPVLAVWKKQKMFLPHARVKVSSVVSLRASDRQGANFESCVWRTVSSHSCHDPQEVLLAQFSLYVHKVGLKPDSFHFISAKSKVYICLLKMWKKIKERKINEINDVTRRGRY